MPEAPPDDTTVRIRAWPDPVIDTIGHDPRSLYAEKFWLPTLGPTSLLLLRHLARRFEHLEGDQVLELALATTSQALGLGPRTGKNSPLVKSLGRLGQFDLAYAHNDGTVAVRRNLPPIGRRYQRRLPRALADEHQSWLGRSGGSRELVERRARRVALTMAELGEDVDLIEHTLFIMGFQPLVCRDAATWAQARRRAEERSTPTETSAPPAA